MQTKSNDFLWVVLIGVALWWGATRGNSPAPAPTPSGLGQLVANTTDRAEMAAFYRDFADVIRRDTGILTTVGQFRTAHFNAVALVKQGTLKAKYPEVGQAISDRLAKDLGLDDQAIDAAKRAAIVAALEGLSKEFGG